jgi:hypothetical protein
MEPNDVPAILIFAGLAAVYILACALEWHKKRKLVHGDSYDHAAAREEHWYEDLKL